MDLEKKKFCEITAGNFPFFSITKKCLSKAKSASDRHEMPKLTNMSWFFFKNDRFIWNQPWHSRAPFGRNSGFVKTFRRDFSIKMKISLKLDILKRDFHPLRVRIRTLLWSGISIARFQRIERADKNIFTGIYRFGPRVRPLGMSKSSGPDRVNVVLSIWQI